MRKVRLLVVVIALAVVLVAVLAPAASATRACPAPEQITASGEWSWWGGVFTKDVKVGTDEYFKGYEYGAWDGTFSGRSFEPFWGVFHGDGTGWALITIEFKGEVAGRHGRAVLQLSVDIRKDDTMGGHWMVDDGSGGLRSLTGVGTWEYVGANDKGHDYADYAGVLWLH
jgi:hypothetical protein